MYIWSLAKQNEIKFVLLDELGEPLAGLGDTFVVEIAKAGQLEFSPGLGVKAEMGGGWYSYTATALEANTGGIVALRISGEAAQTANVMATVLGSLPVTDPATYACAPTVLYIP